MPDNFIKKWFGAGQTRRDVAPPPFQVAPGVEPGAILDRLTISRGWRYRILPNGRTIVIYEIHPEAGEIVKGVFSGVTLWESALLAKEALS